MHHVKTQLDDASPPTITCIAVGNIKSKISCISWYMNVLKSKSASPRLLLRRSARNPKKLHAVYNPEGIAAKNKEYIKYDNDVVRPAMPVNVHVIVITAARDLQRLRSHTLTRFVIVASTTKSLSPHIHVENLLRSFRDW